MAKRERLWISKHDMTLADQKVMKGQLVKPTGARNDHLIFGDNTHWTARYDPITEPLLCDTDGCTALFTDDGNLARHRLTVHGPERDDRERAKVEERHWAEKRELQPDGEILAGETTIGGHVVTEVKKGPRGPVPYLDMTG